MYRFKLFRWLQSLLRYNPEINTMGWFIRRHNQRENISKAWGHFVSVNPIRLTDVGVGTALCWSSIDGSTRFSRHLESLWLWHLHTSFWTKQVSVSDCHHCIKIVKHVDYSFDSGGLQKAHFNGEQQWFFLNKCTEVGKKVPDTKVNLTKNSRHFN